MKIKSFLLSFLLTLLCSTAALSSDITVSSTTVTNWTGPTSGVELRGFLSSTLTVPSGTALAFTASSSTDKLTIPGHSLAVGNAIYLSIGTAGVLPGGLAEGTRYYVLTVVSNDITVGATAGGSTIDLTTNGSGTIYVLTSTTSYPASSPTTGVTAWRWIATVSCATYCNVDDDIRLRTYTLTLPSITIPATTNAVSGYGARWSFYFYRTSNNAKIAEWSGYSNLRVPTSPASTSWDAIKIYNNNTLATTDTSTYTKSEIDALLISCCAGGGGLPSAYTRVQEEGSDLTQRTTLNFVGAGFTAADNSTRTNVTLNDQLNTIAGLSTQGFLSRKDSTHYYTRSITGRSNQIDVSFGNGVDDNVSLVIPDTLQIGQDGTGGILAFEAPGTGFVMGLTASPASNFNLTFPNALPGSTSCLQFSSTGTGSWNATCGSGGGGGAPTNATYMVLNLDATLTDERRLVHSTGLTEVDGGAGGDFTVTIDQSFAPTWTGLHIHKPSATVPGDAVSLSIDARTTNGERNSHNVVWRGWDRTASVNTSVDWRAFVTVATASTSAFTLTSRTNANAYATRFQVDNNGNVYVSGVLQAGSGINLTDGTGNLLVAAFAAASLSGNATKLTTTTGTLTSGRCAQWDANGNLVQASGACGGGAPAGSTLDYQINNAGSLGAGQLKDLAGGAISLTDGSGGGGTLRAIPTSPSQITSDQTNYTITGRSLNLRLSTDARRVVKGLTFTGNTQVDGEWHLISNVGNQPLELSNEDGSATAANRFHTASGRNVILLGDRAALTYWDSTSQRWRVFPQCADCPEKLYTQTATKSIANTTTETSMMNATFTTPVNFFTVGRTVHIKLYGEFTTAISAPTLRIKVKAGSTVIADSTAVTVTSLSGTHRNFVVDIAITCTSVGGTGAFDASGRFAYNTAANGSSAVEIVNALTALDTSSTQAFDVTAQFGTANAQNSLAVFSGFAIAY